MAFGVPSWALQEISTEKSKLKINIHYVCKCIGANVSVNAPVTFSVILLQLVQAVKVKV